MRLTLILLLGVLALSWLRAADDEMALWERAIVTIEVTRKQYDYLQPWSRRVDQVQKMGTMIREREILTTADFLADHTLIRLQKGRGRWYRGEVTWIDYHANLAIVTCPDDTFWEETATIAPAARSSLPAATAGRSGKETLPRSSGCIPQ